MNSTKEQRVSEAMRNLFAFFDPQKSGYITAPQVQLLHEEIRMGGISIPQVLACIEFKNLNRNHIYLSDLPDLLQEMDRRYFLVQDLQWEFSMLDCNHVGAISIDTARFLMEARHGKTFSERSWERLLSTRPVPDAPIRFAEIEVELCGIMQPDVRDLVRETEEKAQIKTKVQLSKRESRQRLELKQKQKEEVDGVAEENERKLEAERKQREEQEKKMDEERERNARDAESKDKEAEEEEKHARQQEKMLLDAAKKQKDAEKRKQAEKEAREAAKKAEAARRKRIRTQLKLAVESQNREKLTKSTKDFKEAKLNDDGDLAKAERLLKMFQCADELNDAMSKRLIKELENAISKAKKNGFDKGELADLVPQAEELLTRLRRLEKLRHEVLELKSSTIAEIRSYQKPPVIVHDVMMATYLLLGTPLKETQRWPNVQVLLAKTGKVSLKRRIGQLNVSDIDKATAIKAKSRMGEIDLEIIRDVSAGAATFYVWVEGMVEEILVSNE